MNRKTDISQIQFRNRQSTQVCGPQPCVLFGKTVYLPCKSTIYGTDFHFWCIGFR